MSFYDLQNLFWQLDASERFSGTETRLYFYWLNRLNAGLAGEYWPDEYPRWGKQVEADLGLTDKTLAAARTVLVKRGLLSYREGTKSRAALWGLGKIARNNSDQSAPIPPNMGRNNSGESGTIPPNMSRNNSGLYKEKTEDLNNDKDKDTLPAASAAAPTAKMEEGSFSEKPNASASHTEGGATDVATSVGDGQKGQNGQDCGQTDKAASRKPARSRSKKDKSEPEHFAAFWQAYPRHDDREKAMAAFARLSAEDQAAAPARAAQWIARRTDWISPEGKDYRPYPATWLNNRRWKELSEPLPTPSTATHVNPTANTSYQRPANGAKPDAATARQLTRALSRALREPAGGGDNAPV